MEQQAPNGAAPLEPIPLHIAIKDIESVAQDLVDGVEALGQQAQELAESTEKSRVEILRQSAETIDGLEKKARELATAAELSRIESLSKAAEVRQLNDELDQRVSDRTAELEAANEELDAFSYSVSHDLRAPLRAIDGFARILSEDHFDAMPEAAKHCVKMVRSSAAKMRQMVEGLLAFSRVSLQPPTKTTVEPGLMVRECLDDMTIEQQGRSVDFVIGELPSCMADAILLKQVWTNLLSNALKYTRNQKSARIEIGSRTEPAATGPEVIYFVKDNGVGFDMKQADKLFGVFQRLHMASEFEGTGAGLAITQRIVQRHGGRIWGEAKPNEGATFSFTLA